jgi:hypothetical protein
VCSSAPPFQRALYTYYDLSASPTAIPPAGDDLIFTRREWDAAALLWHRLMGTRILRPHLSGAPARLRVFAAGAPTGGGTTLLALNLDARQRATVTLGDRSASALVYRVDAPSLLGRTVRLNGRILRSATDGSLPPLSPQRIHARTHTLSPASYAFVVQPGVSPVACR